MKKTWILTLFIVLIALLLPACDVFVDPDDSTGPIEGSGHIAAREVSVAPELGGKVIEINAVEGESVQQGEVLLRFDAEIYQAQYEQAVAAVGAAEAAVATQKAQLEAAQNGLKQLKEERKKAKTST